MDEKHPKSPEEAAPEDLAAALWLLGITLLR